MFIRQYQAPSCFARFARPVWGLHLRDTIPNKKNRLLLFRQKEAIFVA